ncbi:MAG TPA: aromatic ring-hydroxylating dioxygenase subunit alpha [Mycobacteriales bacterium]|nr:aromatic ring-hydroxylating dioxygenase subunit alpha [Mycobacteriales bacterium]
MAGKQASKRPIPFAMDVPDRIAKERYYDADFYALETEQLWPRVWQMACRLEEIPSPRDYVSYEILDQSVILVRGDDMSVKAFHNACRHRGVRLVEGSGTCTSGFTCPFHGWCYDADGANTFVSRASTFSAHNLGEGDIDLVPVLCETWGGCAWINLDPQAPPLRASIEPFATYMDAWQLDNMHPEWWSSFRLPVNWKLAQEAFMEQYHVLETHPELRLPGRYPSKNKAFDQEAFLESEMQYLRVMSDGMAGMVHANDVKIAERLKAKVKLPADPVTARTEWERSLNDAVVKWHRTKKHLIPDLNQIEADGLTEPMVYCFPHVFILPMYSSASQYRFRPLGPEETLMEIWSLTRFPEGAEPPRLPIPQPWAHDDPRVPPIPTQDFSNLPKQQLGLHSRSFDYMRISGQIEGHLSNFHRTIDGYLEGRPSKKLLGALKELNINPLERPVVDLGL